MLEKRSPEFHYAAGKNQDAYSEFLGGKPVAMRRNGKSLGGSHCSKSDLHPPAPRYGDDCMGA